MYDGTVTHADPHCLESWDMEGGLKAYAVYDQDAHADPPTSWGCPGTLALIEWRHNYSAEPVAGQDRSHEHRMIDSAVKQWGLNHDLIERYLRIFGDAVAVDYTNDTHTRAGWTVIGMVTRADSEGITDPELYLKGELETYRQWAEGEVYGVIVNDPETGHEESLWGCYDDSHDFKYLHEVAEDLAHQLAFWRNQGTTA